MENILHKKFIDIVKKYPDNICLEFEGLKITYKELYEKSYCLAIELQKIGVGRNSKVGLITDKSPSAYLGILAILMAGGTYVVLDPGYPIERLKVISEVANFDLVLFSEDSYLNVISEIYNVSEKILKIDYKNFNYKDNLKLNLTDNVKPQDLAYIMFTSGSSGVPKGVMVTHENVCTFVDNAINSFGFSYIDKVSGHSSLSFDLSASDIFCSFFSGATLVPVVNDIDKMFPGNFIKKFKITVWTSVPSVLVYMKQNNEICYDNFSSLRSMIFIGEKLPVSYLIDLINIREANFQIINSYGPTEATVYCAYYLVDKELISKISYDSVPIGMSFGINNYVFIWNKKENRLCHLGERGEIYISGKQVALGYLNNKNESNLKFIKDPRKNYSHLSCFCTGDTAILTDLGIVFIGRSDTQVKIMGHRVELLEIEKALRELEEVIDAVVSKVTEKNNDFIVASIVASNTKVVSYKYICKALKDKLPIYMIPSKINFVKNLPKNVNGKIDRLKVNDIS